LIQANYRAGYFTHYAGEGTVKSLKVSYGGEEADLCLCRTKAGFEREGGVCRLVLDPVEIEFSDLKFKIQSIFEFKEGSSAIKTVRKVFDMSKPARVELNEYITACYGTTEYPEDMSGIILDLDGAKPERIEYAYKCREAASAGALSVSASVGAIDTRVSMDAGDADEGYFREGYAFSPMFTLGLRKSLAEGEEFTTWLRLKKEQ
jgi:hypothetical protein